MFEQFLPELKHWVQQKLQNSKNGCNSTKLHEWSKIKSDPEILQTKKGLALEFLEEPSVNKVGMMSEPNSPQIMSEVNKLLKKYIGINTAHEEGEFIFPTSLFISISNLFIVDNFK